MYVFATIINCVLATSLVFVVYDNNIDNLVLRKNTIAEDIWECITGVSFLLFLLEATFIFFGGLAGMIELEQIKKFALTNVCLIVIVNGVLLKAGFDQISNENSVFSVFPNPAFGIYSSTFNGTDRKSVV